MTNRHIENSENSQFKTKNMLYNPSTTNKVQLPLMNKKEDLSKGLHANFCHSNGSENNVKIVVDSRLRDSNKSSQEQNFYCDHNDLFDKCPTNFLPSTPL